MFDLPEHFQVGVDRTGNGPREKSDPDFDRYVCWCGDGTCQKYIGTWREDVDFSL